MAKSAEIVRLAKSGVKPMVISHRLEVHPNTVYNILRGARRNGEDIPLFTHRPRAPGSKPEGPKPSQITVPLRLLSLLEREAERRKLTTTELAQRLLEDALLAKAVRHD